MKYIFYEDQETDFTLDELIKVNVADIDPDEWQISDSQILELCKLKVGESCNFGMQIVMRVL